MKNIDPQQIKLDQLASYRKGQGLSSQHVADTIKVSLNVVNNIEQGCFNKVGSAPFVRGHVINYCKVLGLDPSIVLAQIPGQILQHQNVQRPDAFLPKSISKVRIKTNHYGRYVIGTTLLSAVILSGYFVWDKWHLFQLSPESNILSDDRAVTYSSIIPPVQDIGVNSSSEDGTRNIDEPLDDINTDIDDLIDKESLEKSNIDTNNNGLESAINENQDSSKTADISVPNSRFVIELDLQEQVWVSIKTDAGEKIIYDLIGPGLRYYESDEPMDIRIGNADKLQIKINGNVVDLAPHIDKNIAKLHWPLLQESES